MTICFEGLSCSGKTYLIKRILSNSSDLIYIPEFVLKTPKELTTAFCRENDLAKSNLSQAHKKEIVIMDRSYLSTLAYNYILYKQDLENEYQITQNWVNKKLQTGKLIKPDLIVYMQITGKEALKRAEYQGKLNTKYAWYKNPKYAIQFYKNLFKSNETGCPVIVINSFEDVSKQETKLWEELKKFGVN